MSTSIYIHIPFCQQKCRYCDFVSYAGCETVFEPYIAALCREIAGRGGIFSADGSTVGTIFMGGGTPTCLPAALLTKVLSAIEQSFLLTSDAEISVEANPGTVDADKLAVLRESGVNRLSFGVQAFDDVLLKTIGRIHSTAVADQAVSLAKQAGFDNINIDLMHGLPGQTLSAYKTSLAHAVALGADHISAYSLILEEGTPLHSQIACGELSLPDEDEEVAMFDFTHEYLIAHGYEHYEVSNYARKGKRCRHNLTYWSYLPYIGFGAAACSFDGLVRYTNTTDTAEYIETVKHGASPIECSESLSMATRMAEYVFLALRTAQGLSLEDFTLRFSTDFRAYYRNVLTNLLTEGLLCENGKGYVLTGKGLHFGNRVFASFLPD